MNQPLAERMRPRSLDDYIGQLHLVGPGGVVRRMIESACLMIIGKLGTILLE